MKIIENWASVSGKIIEIKPDPSLKDFDKIKLKITGVENHLGYPNLLRYTNDTMEIKLPHLKLRSLGLITNKTISALVRAVGGQNYFFDENTIRIL